MKEKETHIIEKMACQLIDMLPIKEKKTLHCQELNLILDGGGFNGSYMFGSLFYLHVLEKRKYIKVKKISSVSIGAVCGLYYLLNCLDYNETQYSEICHHFKKNNNFEITLKILDKMMTIFPKNVLQIVNDRLYISYYDMKKGKKITKHRYASGEDLIETIKRSCSIPFLNGEEMFYKKRYFDGIMPYVFPSKKTKILHIDLFHHFMDIISIKREENNFYRMNVGLIDIHLLWMKQKNGVFCSYLSNKSFVIKILRNIIEFIIFYIFYVLYLLNKTKNKLFISFIKRYCI